MYSLGLTLLHVLCSFVFIDVLRATDKKDHIGLGMHQSDTGIDSEYSILIQCPFWLSTLDNHNFYQINLSQNKYATSNFKPMVQGNSIFSLWR